jgi:hypothetical protein
MRNHTPVWLLLVTNLPGQNQTLRMRVWRALKAAGAGSLRDGVYVLPDGAAARRTFEEQGREIQSGGGGAYVFAIDSDSPQQNAALLALFDRTDAYTQALTELDDAQRALAELTEFEARRRIAAIGREVAALMATDFFPGESHRQMTQALADAEAALNARFAPDEPHPAQHKIRRRDRKDYQHRLWATREHLWIDRVCSAWLIQRFIDPKAKFLWLKRIKDCPKRAVGFDFDGAEFSHVDAKVTFEVLLRSFALEQDPALSRLASLVHQLDVGGIPVAEAAGFAAIMAGARVLQPGDAALLRSMTPVLNAMYATFSEPQRAG